MTRSALRPRAQTRRRDLRVLLAIPVAASLFLSGCSGSEDGEGEPEEQSTAGGATLSGQWPLTGLPAEGAAPKYPVIVAKIDNTSASSPQIGLSKADLITEELVEGGSTRLAVFYYSQLPQVVGPLRSFRATDIGIVQPADGTLLGSGGAKPTVRRIKEAKIKTVTEASGAPGYFRDGNRTAPYNLFMKLPMLVKKLKSPGAPENYFPWGSKEDFPKGQPATGLAAEFSAGHTTRWQYRGGKYTNLNSVAAASDRFSPDTVLVLRVQVGDAGYLDPAGNPVPETKFTGTGDALVFHGGRVVRGSWSKKGFDAGMELRTKAGNLTLPAGKVWMELVPAEGGDVQIAK